MKENKSRGFAVTLSISFLTLILTSLLFSGFMGALYSFRAQRDIVFSRQQLIAQNAANTVKGFIQEKFIAMEASARLINPDFTSREEQYRLLNYLLSPFPAFRQIILLDSDRQKTIGISRLSKKGLAELTSRFTNDLFTITGQGKQYISPVYVDTITSEPMLIMAVPVKDVFREIRGILIAEVNLKFMWDLVENLKIGSAGLAYVVDRQGNLIAFGDIALVMKGKNLGNLKVVQEFINNNTADDTWVSIFTGINGTIVLGSFVPFGVPDWAVVTESPVFEAYQTVIQLILIIVIHTLIMAVFAGCIGIYLARRVTGPLVNLTEAAKRIAGGEINLQLLASGPAEIKSLATAFNSMTDQLHESIKSLKYRSQYLDTTVQRYVEYMAQVGQGRLDSRLKLEREEGQRDDSLFILGQQLNDTTANLQGMIVQIRNSTDILKQHEEKLEIYSERLRKSNKELEQFAYIASHDLQEPLRKIIFYGERLKTNYNAILDKKAVEYIERMNNAAIRMENFIKDLLKYSRVMTKAKPFVNVDLNEVIKEVLGDLEIRINETRAEITTGNLPAIDGDVLQIRQLFQNIIGNAIKYHRENVPPVITINSGITGNKDKHFCEITITDNGIGFDNKYADQIFGLFQRLHGRIEYEGTGIGLAICKKIVEQHGGVISAFSKEGEGSVFCIKLPLRHNVV